MIIPLKFTVTIEIPRMTIDHHEISHVWLISSVAPLKTTFFKHKIVALPANQGIILKLILLSIRISPYLSCLHYTQERSQRSTYPYKRPFHGEVNGVDYYLPIFSMCNCSFHRRVLNGIDYCWFVQWFISRRSL